MKLFHRPTPLPAKLRSQINARQVTALFCATEETWLIAPPHGLVLADDERIQAEYGWEEIQQITWDRDTDTLSIRWPDPSKQAQKLHNPDIDALRVFGDYSRNYLNKSQIYTHFGTTPGGTSIRITVRAKSDGTKFSEVVAFGPLSQRDQSYVDTLENQVRDMAGLPV